MTVCVKSSSEQLFPTNFKTLEGKELSILFHGKRNKRSNFFKDFK